jgi:hypothetical protein
VGGSDVDRASIPIAKIRCPEFVDTIENLSRDDHDELCPGLVRVASGTVDGKDEAP